MLCAKFFTKNDGKQTFTSSSQKNAKNLGFQSLSTYFYLFLLVATYFYLSLLITYL